MFKQFAPRDVNIQLHGTSSFITVTTGLKAQHRTGQEGPEGELRYSVTISLTSALDWGGGLCHARPLYSWERPGIHFIRG